MPDIQDGDGSTPLLVGLDADTVTSRARSAEDCLVISPHNDGVGRGESQVLGDGGALVDITAMKINRLSTYYCHAPLQKDLLDTAVSRIANSLVSEASQEAGSDEGVRDAIDSTSRGSTGRSSGARRCRHGASLASLVNGEPEAATALLGGITSASCVAVGIDAIESTADGVAAVAFATIPLNQSSNAIGQRSCLNLLGVFGSGIRISKSGAGGHTQGVGHRS